MCAGSPAAPARSSSARGRRPGRPPRGRAACGSGRGSPPAPGTLRRPARSPQVLDRGREALEQPPGLRALARLERAVEREGARLHPRALALHPPGALVGEYDADHAPVARAAATLDKVVAF